MTSEADLPDSALVDQFVAVTEATVDTARTFVSAADGDLQTAIAMYFAGVVVPTHSCADQSPA